LNRRLFRAVSLSFVLVGLPLKGESQDQRTPLVVVDVPFLAQTEELCGGAAAAMVLRYWGVADAQADDFQALVRKDLRGISTEDLVDALDARGLVARPIHAEPSDARVEIARGRPLIALIDGGGGRLHYVVIVAWANGRVLFHDLALGPFRLESESKFLRSWQATTGFALVVTPRETTPVKNAGIVPTRASRKSGECDPLVDHAIEAARGVDPELAVPELTAASRMCPNEGTALAALAGVRFRQKRWVEAAAFARQATERDPTDDETWRLLGASLYLSDEPRPALAAWNRIDEPRLDRVDIEGLARTRADIATAVIGLRPKDPLTLEALGRAERRLEQLPTASGGKVSYRPRRGGLADAVVSVGEGGLTEPGLVLALRLGADFVGKREVRLRINSPTSRGEALEIGGRIQSERPAAWVSLEVPRLAGLPGVVSLSGLWDRQTYALAASSGGTLVETRRRGAFDWSHWWTSSLRLDLGVGAERIDGHGGSVSLRGSAERRLFSDRAALTADGARWMGVDDTKGFAEFGGTVAFRSATRPRRWVFAARFDGRRATSDAPLALWPSAGTGASRAFLLRGSPLLTDGIVTGEVFGRGLLHATVEAELQILDRALLRFGLAAFADWARPWDTSVLSGPGNDVFAIGAGLRVHAPGATAFRLDIGKRPGDPGVTVSAGVIPPWPR